MHILPSPRGAVNDDLPADSAAEIALLGAILTAPSVLDSLDLRAADMADPWREAVLARAITIHRRGGDASDLTALLAELAAVFIDGEPAASITRLMEVVSGAGAPANAPAYAATVAGLARRRHAMLVAADLASRASRGDISADDIAASYARARSRDDMSCVSQCDMVAIADVPSRPITWLWRHRVPAGRITLLVGRPGEGKSYLTCDMASRISTGTPWPDGAPCERGSVVLLTAEDDPADTIRPRLDAHRADCSRVHLLRGVRRAEGDRLITLADIDAIDSAISSLGDCRLMIVDPIGSFLGGGVDGHRDNEVRAVLAPLAAMAERHGVAVLVVAHTRKAASASADDMTMGSRAFVGLARATWHLSRDAEKPARRLLLPGKNNLAATQYGLAFDISGEPAQLHWERDPVDMSADDHLAALAATRRPGPSAAARTECEAWLRAALSDGPRLAADVKGEWREVEGGASRTLDRARQAVGVTSYRPEIPGPWWWRLGAAAPESWSSV